SVYGIRICKRRVKHLVEQSCPSRSLYVIEKMVDRIVPVFTQQVQILQCLFIGNKIHAINYVGLFLPFRSISIIPSLLMMIIPCRSSVIPGLRMYVYTGLVPSMRVGKYVKLILLY